MTTLKINSKSQIVDIDDSPLEIPVGRLFMNVDGYIKFRVNPLREALTEDEQVQVDDILKNINGGEG